jgi:hypothetical protein
MSITPAEFQKDKFMINEPIKAEGAHDYATLQLRYGGRKFSCYLPGTTDQPGVDATAIKENPKKLAQLTQAVFIEDQDLLTMVQYIEEEAYKAIIAHKAHPAMPKVIAKYKDVEQLKEMFPSIKGIVHYPKIKDPKTGKATAELDPDASPLIYYTIMRANPTGPKKGQVFSKYYSAQLLDPDIERQVKDGTRKESEFLFPVVADPKTKAVGLLESKRGMRIIPTILFGDVFVSLDKIKIRLSISDAYVLSFRDGEPANRANVRKFLAAAGLKMDQPLMIPSAPIKDDESANDSNVVNNDLKPEAQKGTHVTVVGDE